MAGRFAEKMYENSGRMGGNEANNIGELASVMKQTVLPYSKFV